MLAIPASAQVPSAFIDYKDWLHSVEMNVLEDEAGEHAELVTDRVCAVLTHTAVS